MSFLALGLSFFMTSFLTFLICLSMLPLIFSLPGSLGSETTLYFLGGILAPAFLASDKAMAVA